MATVVRRIDPIVDIVCTAHNALKTQIGAGSFFHLDASEETVTAANATDLPTSLALCNQILGVVRFHCADTLALKVVDAVMLAAVAAPGSVIDLAGAIAAANAVKAAYNVHRASTTYHYTADSTNTVTSADATDQASLNTLLNEMKGDLVAHLASAPAAASLRAVSA